jgi:hypothetical protein
MQGSRSPGCGSACAPAQTRRILRFWGVAPRHRGARVPSPLQLLVPLSPSRGSKTFGPTSQRGSGSIGRAGESRGSVAGSPR